MQDWQTRGHVEVICGPMFSGKTEELIKRVRRARIARQRVIVFKPRIDDRYDAADVVSHSAHRIDSLPIASSAEIDPILKAEPSRVAVIGIDEAQFFDDGIVEVVQRLADRGARVVVAGLEMDYLCRPFGPMPRLLCLAEEVTKQLSVCMVCGAPASRSQRVHKDAKLIARQTNDTILVGGGDAYEARCRGCYVLGIDAPSAHSPEGKS
ncbi:MAG: thymidine kinase [Deltaproteobacteria bacterium]|nr:thymidine kinase [Deltaproteobacteria bacterium]